MFDEEALLTLITLASKLDIKEDVDHWTNELNALENNKEQSND